MPNQGTGPRDDALAWALHRLAAAWAVDDVHLARRLHVTPGDYLALKHVAANDGIGPAELSRRLGMSTGSVNALINRLVAAGRLQRRRHEHDARRLTLHLDRSTENVITSHYQAQAEFAATNMSDFSPDQRAAILHFLTAPAWFGA